MYLPRGSKYLMRLGFSGIKRGRRYLDPLSGVGFLIRAVETPGRTSSIWAISRISREDQLHVPRPGASKEELWSFLSGIPGFKLSCFVANSFCLTLKAWHRSLYPFWLTCRKSPDANPHRDDPICRVTRQLSETGGGLAELCRAGPALPGLPFVQFHVVLDTFDSPSWYVVCQLKYNPPIKTAFGGLVRGLEPGLPKTTTVLQLGALSRLFFGWEGSPKIGKTEKMGTLILTSQIWRTWWLANWGITL